MGSRASRSQRSSPGAARSNPVSNVTPLTIFTTTGVGMWIRADRGVTGGANVTAIADQGAGGHNMAPIGTGPVITASDATLSGLQTLAFNNTLNLVSSAYAQAAPFYYLLVVKPVTWNSGVAFVRDPTLSNNGQLAYSGGSPNCYQNNGSFANGGPLTLGSWQRLRASYTGSTADSLKIGSAAAVSGSSAGAATPAAIGFNYALGADLGVWAFYEFIALPGTPTPGELTAYDAYLFAKSPSIAV